MNRVYEVEFKISGLTYKSRAKCKCCEGCIVPSMVTLMYQLKSVLK